MQTQKPRYNAGDVELVTVKVKGPRGLCELIFERLESDFTAKRTSSFIENEEGGVHAYMIIAGVRE